MEGEIGDNMEIYTRKSITKWLSVFIIICMLVAGIPVDAISAQAETINSWDGTADLSWYQSDKTSYEISTPQQLAGMAQLVNQGNTFEGKTITLCEDIYLNEKDTNKKYEWISIASCSTRDDTELQFEGTFDGNEHRIYHMYVSETGSGGLFGRIGRNGIVKSVTIEDGICDYGGCIANVNEGEILFCRNKSDVWKKNEFSIGGICNYNYNILYGCQNYGTVSGSMIGGIVGSNMEHGSSVENCSNHGVVLSTSEAAGIAAYNYSWIYNCYNVGTVASEGRSISGIVYQNDHVVTNCYVAGDFMYGTDTWWMDAICISNNSEILNCYYIPANDVTSSDGTEITQEDIAKPSFLEQLNIKQYDWQTGDWIADEYGLNDGMPIHPADYNLSAGTGKKIPELWFDSMKISLKLEDGFYELNVRGFYNSVIPVITVSDNSLAEAVYEGTVESGKVIIKPKNAGEGQITITIPNSTSNYRKQYTIDLQIDAPIQHECSTYTEVIIKQPTCTQKGEKSITCNECGSTRTEEMEMVSHAYTESGVVYPTYETEGYTNYTCIYCGHTEIWNIKPKLKRIPITDSETGETYIQYKVGDYNFISRDGKTAELWGYYGDEKNVVIPQTVYADGMAFTITGIGEHAFYKESYESIVLPDTVTKMEDWTNHTKVTGYIYLPKSLNTIEADEDVLGNAQYMCWKDSYAHRYLLDMEDVRELEPSLEFSIFCVDAPPKVTGLSQIQLGTDSVTLNWHEVQNGSGYIIVSCDKNGRNEKTVATISDAKTISHNISGLKSDTNYYYKIRSVHNYEGRTYYSDYSEVLLIHTKPSQKKLTKQHQKIKKGYTAKITHKKIKLPASVLTTYNSADLSYKIHKDTGLLIECSHGEWATVNELSHFWDYKGLYNLACANSKHVFITRYDNRLKKKKTIQIKKKYPLVGDVIGDDNGNYYIVWGRADEKGTAKFATMAVSKYTYAGKHVKTYYTSGEGGEWSTCIPFEAGNCSTVIADGVLVCLYAREMYNMHQSSGLIAINTDDMFENEYYSTYTSHSFNQHVIALRGGGVCYADHGDGYPRGFSISFSNTGNYEEQVPFHFYGELGENYTNAMLGGICETSGGILLVGASAKAMTKKAEKQGKNLFIQLVDPERKISGSVSRKGTACGVKYTDTGVKWLTNYSNKYDVENPQIVKTDDDRIVVLWEKFKGSEFIQSYYMIFAADGSTIQEATPMNGTRLSSFENPLYKDGKVYWTTAGEIVRTRKQTGENRYMSGYKRANGKQGVVHCLTIGKVVKNR